MILLVVPIVVSLLQFIQQLSKEYAWAFGSKSLAKSRRLSKLWTDSVEIATKREKFGGEPQSASPPKLQYRFTESNSF